MVEPRRESNPIAGRRHFFPALAGRSGHPNQCAKTGAEECANGGNLSAAHHVTVSAASGQRAARSPDTGADTRTDRRIDASGAGSVTRVQPHDFRA
jgi:hypothetical protein